MESIRLRKLHRGKRRQRV